MRAPTAGNGKHVLLLVAVAAVLALLAAGAGADQTVLVPYHTATMPSPVMTFDYMLVDHFTWMDFYGHAYDASHGDWPNAATPFGGGYEHDTGGVCPLADGDGHTDWPVDGDVVVRFDLPLCAGVKNLEVHAAIDNAVMVWVNGLQAPIPANCVDESQPPRHQPTPEGMCNFEGCAYDDRATFPIPDSYLIAGNNEIAIRACDHGLMTYLDFEVIADTSEQVCEPTPECEDAVPTITEIWPPNHKFVAVAITGVVDSDGNPLTATITSVWQDEVTPGPGKPHCPDATAVPGSVVQLRAERLGTEDGRIYHLNFTAAVPGGESCTGTVAVCVPHDQGAPENCVDQGPLYDSTLCPE